MKTSYLPLAALAAAAALFSAGCASQQAASAPKNATESGSENREKFVLMDPGAQQSVSCLGLQETTLPDGRLKVVANVKNRENRRIQVQINCEFKDAQGFAIDSTPFQTLILTENGQESVPFESFNDMAKNYTVRVRQAR